MSSVRQRYVDAYYWSQNRPCCAGCDWWRHINSVGGVCNRFPAEVPTTRDHACGEFRDSFDWSTLPLAYQRSVGVRTP